MSTPEEHFLGRVFQSGGTGEGREGGKARKKARLFAKRTLLIHDEAMREYCVRDELADRYDMERQLDRTRLDRFQENEESPNVLPPARW